MPSYAARLLAPRRAAFLLVAGLAAVAVLLWFWWPGGVLLGLALGVVAVLAIGRWTTAAADAELVEAGPVPAEVDEEHVVEELEAELAPEAAEPGVRADLERLKAELGDDYPDFTRAARLVVSSQYASAARLQRELAVPYSRARRLLDDLERSHFVGPKTGSLPRQVLLPAERLPEMERLFADA